MAQKCMTPHIMVREDGVVEILGEPEGLEALGQLLIAKSKLGRNLVANFYDGVNPIIYIQSSDDLYLEKYE